MEANERKAEEREPGTESTDRPGPARTVPSGATRAAEREEAQTSAGPDRPPNADEEAAAPTTVTDEQRAHAEEMLERGAHQEGEGRIV